MFFSSSGSQRSQSCTDPVEDGGGKLKGVTQPGLVDRVCESTHMEDVMFTHFIKSLFWGVVVNRVGGSLKEDKDISF